MNTFPVDVLDLLHEAGWYEGRTVTTARSAAANLAAGYFWSAAADDFLHEFSDLRLRFFRLDGSISTLSFKVEQALTHEKTAAAVADCIQRLGRTTLTVIGQAYEEDLLLLMDVQGRVYGCGCDDCLYLVGQDGATAINAVCLDMPFQQV